MIYYFLALFLWVLEIVMIVSIILIPVIMYLRDNYLKWKHPFLWAYWNS